MVGVFLSPGWMLLSSEVGLGLSKPQMVSERKQTRSTKISRKRHQNVPLWTLKQSMEQLHAGNCQILILNNSDSNWTSLCNGALGAFVFRWQLDTNSTVPYNRSHFNFCVVQAKCAGAKRQGVLEIALKHLNYELLMCSASIPTWNLQLQLTRNRCKNVVAARSAGSCLTKFRQETWWKRNPGRNLRWKKWNGI